MSTIIALLNQIKNDEIVLPGIQRNFVWDEESITRLLDSLLRGYPVGIALLWETYNDIQYRSFIRDYAVGAPIVYNDNSSGRRLKLVLDGQQRLQSLYIALYGRHDGRDLYFDVLSGRESDDLSSERYSFRFLKSADAEVRNASATRRHHWVRARDLFAWTGAQKIAFRAKLAQEYQLDTNDAVRLDLNFSQFDDALTRDENVLRVSTIDENLAPDSPLRKGEADVLEIFFRINREGTPLSRSDLIFSMLKLNWKESAELLPEFLTKINDGNSLDLTTDFVIRCLFVVSDLGGKLDLDVLRSKQNVAKLQDNFQRCCNAIEATVDFVIQHCRCESSTLMGSANTAIPFVYFLYHAPSHQMSNRQLPTARKAFYLLALSRPFTRYGESRVGAFVRTELQPLCATKQPTFPLERVIAWIRYWERVDSIEKLVQRNVAFTLHLVQGLSGAKVQYSANAPEVDHIFPRARLRDRSFPEEEINTVGNYWILAQGKNRNKSDKPPGQYFADVDDHTLNQAIIDRKLLQYSLYRRFLRQRLAGLTERVVERIGLSDRDMTLLTSTSAVAEEDNENGWAN